MAFVRGYRFYALYKYVNNSFGVFLGGLTEKTRWVMWRLTRIKLDQIDEWLLMKSGGYGRTYRLILAWYEKYREIAGGRSKGR